MDIISKKYWYFIFSLIIIIPGIISLMLWGLNLSIDFTGGSRIKYEVNSKLKTQNSKLQVKSEKLEDNLVNIFTQEKIKIVSIQKSGNNIYIVRTIPLDQQNHEKVNSALSKDIPGIKEVEFETIGPTIGNETTTNAVKGVLLACVLIVIYIAWAFRKVPKPASSLRFGICAIVALVHDILLVVGFFSILGHFFKVEVDSLFVTALLTVLGFSVHDTIVVFDRIRENLRRMAGTPFEKIVNDSILQTLGRSLNTSLTVLLVLFTLLLFGGESIKWFVVALLIGVASGTYSSIFNAAPLLDVWEEWSRKKSNNS
ncbi:protein translocase subunit SecF [Candidatus Microgenomates bacterium]|nr:MAG: protein translocase subunit SecF [Candidatus Microgenomates bacterium]